MLDSKSWYASKTVWGAAVTIIASLLNLAGFTIAEEVRDELIQAAITLAGALGGALALYGRISADAKIVPGMFKNL